MDLWIRSQNKKTLRKIDNISVSAFRHELITFIEHENVVLGTYASNERALEILDEIQKILLPSYFIRTSQFPDTEVKHLINNNPNVLVNKDMASMDVLQLNTFIYQMPKE